VLDTVRRRPLAVVAGVAASLGFGYLAVRDVDYGVFADTIGNGTYWWIAPSLAALAVSVTLRALRWRYLFSAETRPPLTASLRALLIGDFFNTVLPLRAGELVRVVAIHRDTRTSRPEALGTIVVERLLDVVVLLLLLMVIVPFVPKLSWLGVAVAILVIAVAAALAASVVLRRYGARPLAFILRPLRWLPRLSSMRADAAAESLLRGLHGLRDFRTGAVAMGLTTATWLAGALCFWLAMRGLRLDLGYDAALLVVIATSFALVIPALPASLGVFEAATVVSLDPFRLDDSQALACAVVLHALSVVPFVAAGLVALGRQRGLAETLGRARASEPSAHPERARPRDP
jgi:uncharacterized protein (TIRG00374 family)